MTMLSSMKTARLLSALFSANRFDIHMQQALNIVLAVFFYAKIQADMCP